jgi:toxin CptA
MTRRSTPWCNGYVPCRIEWRPSRWLLAALFFLSIAAPIAVLASGLPRGVAWPLAAAAAFQGLGAFARERRRVPRSLSFTPDGRLMVDGTEAGHVRLQWRGPLAFLSWRDATGRRQRLAWWPDTLPSRRRRELRLAAGRLPAAPGSSSVAP